MDSTLITLISIGIAVNSLVNIIWIFVLTDIRSRIHRLESYFMSGDNKKEKEEKV